MAVLHPEHPHVTIHNWDARCRPRLASVVDLIRRSPLLESATTKAASFRIAHGLPERHRNHALTVEYDTYVDFAQHADKCLSDPDFVDDLLAVVAKVHSSNWSVGASYPTWPASPSLVLQLVTTCLSKFLDNAVFHDAAWIAMRKLPSPLAPLRHLGEKYTRVPLLVTLPVSPQVAVEHTLSQPHSDDSSPSEASEAIESFSDLSEFLAAGMKIKIPGPRCEWLELPVAPRSPLLQRNVFAAESPQHSLCILVVADSDTICDAMSSALYHRLAWGVRGPLAGISYVPGSPVVALHLGWLDDSSCSLDDLPQVHILGPKASPSVHDDDYPQNLYSMVDPGDVLSLARVLLSFRHSFADDLKAARLLDVELLPQWRADQELACSPRGSRWTPETVEEWSRRIERGPNPDLSSPITYNDADLDSDVSHPFDRFVAMKDRNGYLPTATSLWLLDRLVIYHSLPPIDVYHDPTTYGLLGEEIQVHVPAYALYRRATQFTWPQSWESLDSLPPLPRALEGLACDLFSAYESGHDGAPHRVAASDLSGEATRILERELATVLRVADLARSLNATSKDKTYQVLYDMLFSILVPCTATQIHPGVAIRLSRSTFYDVVVSGSGDEAVRELRRMHREHFWIQTAVAELFCEADEVRYPLLDGAVQRASTDQNYRYTDLDSVCRRVQEAPTMGACDFALAARFTPTFDKARHPRPLPSIISGHCLKATSRTFPTPYHPSPETFGAPMTMWRTVTFDILASAHLAYPSADTTRLGETRPTPRISARGTRSSPDTTGHDAALRPDNEGLMDVPVLLVVHSVQRMHFNIADSDRLRMCLTSAVQFLASMQILDFPLFGLLTEGTRCAVVMAWATHCEGQTFAQVHMMDQNCTSYDLSDPAGAFNFATFLLWVQCEHVPRLLGRLNEAHRAGLFSESKLVSEDDCSAWSAEAQLKHIKRTVSADPDYHPSAYFPFI